MTPDEEAQHADRKNRKHHRAITEDRLAGKGRKNVRSCAHAREDCDVDLRVAKEPEQMLPQKWRAASVQWLKRAAYIQVSRDEEAGPGDSIKQEQNPATQQDGKRKQRGRRS